MPRAAEKKISAPAEVILHNARPAAVERAARNRRNELMLLYCGRGWTNQRIADELNVSLSTVRTTLPKLLDKQTSQIAQLAQREIVIQLNQVSHLYMEVYDQWEKSKGARGESVTKVEGEAENDAENTDPAKKSRKAAKVTQTTTSIDGLGDPRYITELRALQDRKLKLLGLEKPEQLAIVLANVTMNQFNVAGKAAALGNEPVYTPAELEEIARTATSLGLGFNDSGQMVNIRPALPPPDYNHAADDTIDAEFTEESVG